MSSKKKNQAPVDEQTGNEETTEQTTEQISPVEQKKKVSKAEILQPVTEIKANFEKIVTLTDNLPECSFKESLKVSNKNYQKKLENFLKGTGNIFAVSKDEQELIEKFRNGKLEIREKE